MTTPIHDAELKKHILSQVANKVDRPISFRGQQGLVWTASPASPPWHDCILYAMHGTHPITTIDPITHTVLALDNWQMDDPRHYPAVLLGSICLAFPDRIAVVLHDIVLWRGASCQDYQYVDRLSIVRDAIVFIGSTNPLDSCRVVEVATPGSSDCVFVGMASSYTRYSIGPQVFCLEWTRQNCLAAHREDGSTVAISPPLRHIRTLIVGQPTWCEYDHTTRQWSTQFQQVDAIVDSERYVVTALSSPPSPPKTLADFPIRAPLKQDLWEGDSLNRPDFHATAQCARLPKIIDGQKIDWIKELTSKRVKPLSASRMKSGTSRRKRLSTIRKRPVLKKFVEKKESEDESEESESEEEDEEGYEEEDEENNSAQEDEEIEEDDTDDAAPTTPACD